MSLRAKIYSIRKVIKNKTRSCFKILRMAFAGVKLHIEILAEYIRRNSSNNNDIDLGNNVKLYYWKYGFECDNSNDENLGDYLSKVVVSHFAPNNSSLINNSRITTIYGIGSIIGFRCQNAVVWGSGILHPDNKYLLRAKLSDLDIRAVRGPKTRDQLLRLNKSCPEIYGDPAILMPFIFKPNVVKKIYDNTLVLNHYYKNFEMPANANINYLGIITSDYEMFITTIMQSKRVISSSLHGIILAESYGVPAILLVENEQSMFKYEDWYNSTGRYDIVVAHTIQEALMLEPMALPNLEAMQEKLISTFPHDLWE